MAGLRRLRSGLITPVADSTRRLQAGGFAWPREAAGSVALTREQFDWLVAGLPWQRVSAQAAQPITAV